MASETPRAPSAHVAALLALYAIGVYRFWFLCDDAYITFRYSRNWATAPGLVFNPGEFPPVEGYSNFLWMLMVAGVEAVGGPIEWLVPLASAASGAVLLWRVHHVLRHHLGVGDVPALLASMTLALAPAVGVWATSGLATMPFTLLVFLLFERLVFVRDPLDWAIPALAGMGLALIRTEGIAWVAVITALSLVARARDGLDLRDHGQRLVRAMVPVLALYAMYSAWRFQYFGTLVPNTALVKVGFGPDLVFRGLKYLGVFWLTCLVPMGSLLPAAWLIRGERAGAWLAIALLALAFPAYAVVVGGDFMPFGRLILPGLPLGALLLGGGLQQLLRRQDARAVWGAGLGMVLVGVLPSFDVHLVPERVRELLHFRLSDKEYLSEVNRWDNQRQNTEGFTQRGLALAQVAEPGDTVVAAAVGAVGYFSDLEVLDQHGLVTKEVAYRPLPPGASKHSPGHDKHVRPEFFVKYEPRFLYARAVEGKLAAGRMKDTLDQWDIDVRVMDRYVPDWFEVTLPDQKKRTFLFVVRLRAPGEDPAKLWNDFSARRRALNAELRAQYEDDPDTTDEGSG